MLKLDLGQVLFGGWIQHYSQEKGSVVNKQQLFNVFHLLCFGASTFLAVPPSLESRRPAGRCSPPSQKSKDKARHCSLHCSCRSPPQRTMSNWAHPLVPWTVEIPREHTYHSWMAQLWKMQIYALPRVPQGHDEDKKNIKTAFNMDFWNLKKKVGASD